MIYSKYNNFFIQLKVLLSKGKHKLVIYDHLDCVDHLDSTI